MPRDRLSPQRDQFLDNTLHVSPVLFFQLNTYTLLSTTKAPRPIIDEHPISTRYQNCFIISKSGYDKRTHYFGMGIL